MLYTSKWATCDFDWYYIDKGRSILRLFFLANLTCFVILMHKSKSIVMHNKINARRTCLKYKETAEKTKKAIMTSSHITKITTSTLHPEMERKKVQNIMLSKRYIETIKTRNKI